MKRKLLITLLAIIAVFTCSFALSGCSDSGELEFTLLEDGSGYAVSGLSDESVTDLIIPSEYKSKPVTAISEKAFWCCKELTSVTIPDSITSIGERAFSSCNRLTNVTIPDSITSIGDSAFNGCRNLTNITIPDSLTKIGDFAFSGCSNLTYNEYNNSYYLGNKNNPYIALIVATIDVKSSVTNYTINAATKFVLNYAFSSCCNRLTNITIPDNVTSIGSDAFKDCNKLTGVNYIGDIASWCDISFSDVYANPLYYAHNLYINNFLVTNLVIPDGVTAISEKAFSGGNFTNISIPNSVTFIGELVFDNCTSLTSITIPNSVTSIGWGAFRDCKSLKSITIPNCVTSISNSAFYYCSGLTSVIIPSSVTSIRVAAFYCCSSLEDIYYVGSKADWETVSKDGGWNEDTGNFTVHCSDGKLDKNGNVIE